MVRRLCWAVTCVLVYFKGSKDLCLSPANKYLGVPPKNVSCMLHALLFNHFKRGGYYPKGGASTIPYHITRVIEKHGGKVLVKAPVSQILVNRNGAAYGE